MGALARLFCSLNGDKAPPRMSGGAQAWWREAVVYQIYPRSFADSDGDGVGDLPGITAHLDHLGPDGLGVDAIWLSPIYPSPQDDFGYDVADFCGVHDEYGSLDDLDTLIEAAGTRGIRVLLDFVPNHSSVKHPWFEEAASSRDARTRDWYIWRDPAPGGGPPNNWASQFGGSAWRWHEPTGQYYLATFLPSQADLNWRNPELVAAMHDAMRFWLRRGVAGFRLDVVDQIAKDPHFRDNPWIAGREAVREIAPFLAQEHVYDKNYVDLPEMLAGLRRVTDEFEGTVMVGEVFPDTVEHRLGYYGSVEAPGLHLTFHFELADASWDANVWRDVIAGAGGAVPGHAAPAWALSNHDRPRATSRYDAHGIHPGRPRAAACCHLCLEGVPFVYQGEEIGMRNVEVPPELARDPVGFTYPGFGRDGERTPMRWTSGPGVGFTTGTPWLPDGGDIPGCDVAAQADDPDSLLGLYRRLLRLRKERPALRRGMAESVDAADGLLSFVRADAVSGDRVGVAVNMGRAPAPVPVSFRGGEVLVDSRPGRAAGSCPPSLDPDTAVVVGL
jgi:alpha-glucosidase